MATIVRMKRSGNDDMIALAEKIVKELDIELVCSIKALEEKAVLICCEEYYMRVKNLCP